MSAEIGRAVDLIAQRAAWFAMRPATSGFGSLDGMTVLVTGSCGGLGRAMTRAIIDAGGFVIGTGLDAAACADLGDGFAFVRADLRDVVDIQRLIDVVRESGLNALVNNAGIMAEKSLEETDEDTWAATLDINLTAAYRLSRGLVDSLRQATPASIINISSQLAYTGGVTLTAYGASKAGILGFTRSLAREIGPDVRVNAVAPGPTATPMTDAHLTEEWVTKKTAHLISKRMGEAYEIANVVRFLLSSDSSFINGQTISVNGGGYLS